MEERQFWIFQYTPESRTDRLLSERGLGRSLTWLWNERLRTQPQPGDLVFFLRAGNAPKDYPNDKDWRGFTGIGEVTSEPVLIEKAQTEKGVPVDTVAYAPNDPVADSRLWHDHRLARTSVIFGQQGTNFAISKSAAQAIAQAILGNDSLRGDAEKALMAVDPERGDALTALVEETEAWANNHTARALQTARAVSAVSSRSGTLSWTHLLVGLIVLGGELSDRSRVSALAVVLHKLALGDGDDAALKQKIRQQIGQSTNDAEIDRRSVNPIGMLSSSATNSVRGAKLAAQSRLIAIDELLSGLLNAPGHANDGAFSGLFSVDRSTLIDRIIEEGVERCPPDALQRFAESLDRSVPVIAAPSEDEPLGQPTVTVTPQATTDNTQTGSEAAALEAESVASKPEAAEEPTVTDMTTDSTAPVPSLLGHSIAGTLNDTVSHAEDYLDVRDEARAFARLIASNGFEPPLAIGVFGHWGNGKTFFMERIAESLTDLTDSDAAAGAQSPTNFHGNIVQIKFNAWHYMETNVWASLVDVIFKELDGWLRRKDSDQQNGDKVESLFGSLSTAQAKKLEAIESYAERLDAMRIAQKNVREAESTQEKHWGAIAKDVLKEAGGSKEFEDLVQAFGLTGLRDEAAKVQAAVEETRQWVSEGNLLWRSLRARLTSPGLLVLLVASVLCMPFLFAWLGGLQNIEPSISALTGLAAAASTWFSAVAIRAKSLVNTSRKITDAFDRGEVERSKQEKSTLDQCRIRIIQANKALELAEDAAAAAERELQAGSATGRIAAFIRSRAEGDMYAKHLGIIDTIRRDFEQLTALMSSKGQAKQEHEALEKQQADLKIRIEALRSRYLAPEASAEDEAKGAAGNDAENLFALFSEKLNDMMEMAEQKNPLDFSIDRIVLFIDDLDRCPPDKVYGVLQAVHLFLNFPLFVVVVGVDTRWMETSLIKELDTLVDGTRGTTAQDYLEKIFQIPYWTRQMDARSSRGFVDGILARVPTELPIAEDETAQDEKSEPGEEIDEELDRKIKESSGEETVEEDDEDDTESRREPSEDTGEIQSELAPRQVIISTNERELIKSLAPHAGQSPRQLLRFVNVYGLIKSVTDEEGSPLIDPENEPIFYRALLAQLAIATGSPSSAHRYFNALAGSEVKSLAQLEQSIRDAYSQPGAKPSDLDSLLAVFGQLYKGVGLKAESSADSIELLTKLRETAPIARRYTFASIDAAPPSATARK